MKSLFSHRSSRLLAGLVLASLVFTLAQSGPLNGSVAALVLTVLLQVYLPGVLLARALGKLADRQPIVRLAWVLVSGLGLTIVLGGAARLLNLPVAAYLVILHGLMLVLAALPAARVEAADWHWSRRKLPLYVLVILCSLTLVGISYASRYRFYGFEDQVIFVSHVDWLANNPGETPADQPLRSRQIGAINTRDTRFDTDGWTYNHAAWVWASGVPASQLIWFDLDPLFLWTVPLVAFALAYTITRREEAAAWTAVALTLAGVMTMDNIAHFPGYTALGRLTVVQISTLRQASLTFMLPLTLFTGFAALRETTWRNLLLMGLAGLALAIMHPFQVMLFVISLGITMVLWWLAQPSRAALRRGLWLVLVLALLLGLPLVQRLNRSGLRPADTIVRDTQVEDVDEPVASGYFLILPDVPVIGNTFIRNPADVFYHPVIVLAVVLGLLWGWRWRRSLAAQYIFGTTALAMLLFFTPGLTELYNKFVSSVGLLTTMFLIPVGFILGHSMDQALGWVQRRTQVYPTLLLAALLVGVLALLLFEPVPIPASARDQIESFNQMQQYRRMLPVHHTLTATLSGLIDPAQTSILMAPDDSVSVLIEDLPRTLVTGGRGSSNRARDGDNRFFNQLAFRAPWLDSDDLAYMAEYGVTHIISRPDHTRYAQLRLQPARFDPLGDAPGYGIFGLNPDAAPDTIDGLYVEMNTLYGDIELPRWGPEGFALVRPGDSTTWQPLVDRWTALVEQQPNDDRARLGLAFSTMMAGDDAQALPLWQALSNADPDVALFTQAVAYSHHVLGDPTQGMQVLLAALDNDNESVRVLAARTLLTEDFFYLLDATQLDTALAVTEADVLAWGYLSGFDQPNALRDRAALLMNAGRWTTATAWLDVLPDIQTSPADIAAQAAMTLAQGNVDGALARLRPATDPDWYHAKAFWQPDRWEDNVAAQMYYLLTGDIATRDDDFETAASAYQQAIEAGATATGHYFLAQALTQLEQADEATAARAVFEAAWPDPATVPVSLLTLADNQALYAMQPQGTQDEAEDTLTISAVYGNFRPHNTYPIRQWRVEVVSPDAGTRYADTDVPTTFLNPFPVRVTTTLPLTETIDPLAPATVFITPMYSNTVTTAPLTLPVTLNRPDDAPLPDDALTVDLRFGEAIRLEGYTLDTAGDTIDLTLFWQTEQVLTEDYQVFVHVVDGAGNMLVQADSAPVQNRYPTSQWRIGVTIADLHTLTAEALPDDFSVRVGLYRLPDAVRLPITPADDHVQDNSVVLPGR